METKRIITLAELQDDAPPANQISASHFDSSSQRPIESKDLESKDLESKDLESNEKGTNEEAEVNQGGSKKEKKEKGKDNYNHGDGDDDDYYSDDSFDEFLDALDEEQYNQLTTGPAYVFPQTPERQPSFPSSAFTTHRSPSFSPFSPGSSSSSSSSAANTPSPSFHKASAPQTTPGSGVKRQASILDFLSGKKDSPSSLDSSGAPGKPEATKKPRASPSSRGRGEKGGKGASSPAGSHQSGQTEAEQGAAVAKPKRYMPYYKRMPGTSFSVDAFSYGAIAECNEYFLTHFHSDHYQGLNKKFNYGQIFCTAITAKLVVQELGVDSSLVVVLDVDVTYEISGVRVTFIEANHCPGAVLILFELMPNGRSYLHTGDFRANQQMPEHPLLKNRRVDTLYLDTTYCQPSHTFPSQPEVLATLIAQVAELIEKNPKTLIMVGSYTLGKERVFMKLAEHFGWKICVTQAKYDILRWCNFPNFESQFTTDLQESPLHVVAISTLNRQKMASYLEKYPQYTAVLGIRPTGWTFEEGSSEEPVTPAQAGKINFIGAPYSEHSSFLELRDFVMATRPKNIISTVTCSKQAKEDMNGFFAEWLGFSSPKQQ